MVKIIPTCRAVSRPPESLKLGNNMAKSLPANNSYKNSNPSRSAIVMGEEKCNQKILNLQTTKYGQQIYAVRPRQCVPRHFWHTDIFLIGSVLRYYQSWAVPGAHIWRLVAFPQKLQSCIFFWEFCKMYSSIFNKPCQSNLVRALSSGLLSLCDNLGFRRILEVVVLSVWSETIIWAWVKD